MTNTKTFLFGILFLLVGIASGAYYVPWDWGSAIPHYDSVSVAGEMGLILAGVVLLFVAWHRGFRFSDPASPDSAVVSALLGLVTLVLGGFAAAYPPSGNLNVQLSEVLFFSILLVIEGMLLLALGILPVPQGWRPSDY